MSYLKQKSNFNFDAAEVLQDKSLYAPSVHCSYYSCFQLMKVIIFDFLNITYDQLESDIINSEFSSHVYIINQISNEIRGYSKTEHAEFKRNITQLKKMRMKSDYDDIQITSTDSSKAFFTANEVRKQLKSIFNV
jgi:hypothetical protein